MAMLWWAAQRVDFGEIYHGDSLVKVHSENESDSLDARNEALSKHVHRNGMPLLEEKREKKNFDVVRDKTEEDIYDFEQTSNQLPNMIETVDHKGMKFMSVRMYTVRKGGPLVTMHYNLN